MGDTQYTDDALLEGLNREISRLSKLNGYPMEMILIIDRWFIEMSPKQAGFQKGDKVNFSVAYPKFSRVYDDLKRKKEEETRAYDSNWRNEEENNKSENERKFETSMEEHRKARRESEAQKRKERDQERDQEWERSRKADIDKIKLPKSNSVSSHQKRRRCTNANSQYEGLVTIYKIIYIPENRAVYTGRTKDPARRLAQHASATSKCRLVRNAMRRQGRRNYTIEPIMWCAQEDADANESFWIIENQTMYPKGYNLRHGSAAGEEDANPTALMRTSVNLVPFCGARDEALAMGDAWQDVAAFLEGDDSGTQADQQIRDLLREVHPDHPTQQSYSPTEVAAMLNAVRESMR